MSTEMSQMKKADKMIASRLEDWTYDIIKDMVDKSQGESVSHDFKANIPDVIGLTKDCCAFANTRGGFIILGVKEHGIQFRIEGISNDKEISNIFGQKIHAVPEIYFDQPKIIFIYGQEYLSSSVQKATYVTGSIRRASRRTDRK